MIHTTMPRNCAVILLHRQLKRSAIYGSQIFDSHNRQTVLILKVKGKPRNFEAMLCGSLYILLKHLSNHMHFITNGYKMLFIDQLVRSKATCSFKQNTKINKCGACPYSCMPNLYTTGQTGLKPGIAQYPPPPINYNWHIIQYFVSHSMCEMKRSMLETPNNGISWQIFLSLSASQP